MRFINAARGAAAVLVFSAMLAGCGGGGGGSSSTGSASGTTAIDGDVPTSTGTGYYCSDYRPTPTITAITPSTGTIAGGETLTIDGTGLQGCADRAQVYVGDLPATQVRQLSDGRITCVTPSGVAGTVPVTVFLRVTASNKAGSAASDNAFTYR